MVRVRFAPSPSGSLHVGSALTAVANRRFADDRGGTFVLRIDDTDAARSTAAAEEGILRDLEWLGVAWDEGPVRQSERLHLYREAAERLRESGVAERADDGAVRSREGHRPTLLRHDGTATYHLASVADDAELGITHVIRGKDHLASAELHTAIARGLGLAPPVYLHHGLIVGDDGAKLSKRHGAASLSDLRERGIPGEAVRRLLEELGLPRGDVHFDEPRLRRLAVEALADLSDEELARRAGVDVSLGPALRGAHDLVEARDLAALVSTVPPVEASRSPETLRRFAELRRAGEDRLDETAARALVDELRAGGADLAALRLALTGARRGPELWAVLRALPRDDAMRRAEAAEGSTA